MALGSPHAHPDENVLQHVSYHTLPKCQTGSSFTRPPVHPFTLNPIPDVDGGLLRRRSRIR